MRVQVGAVKKWLCERQMLSADGANGTRLLDLFVQNTSEWVMEQKNYNAII